MDRKFKESLPRDNDIIEEAAGIRVLIGSRFLSGYAHGLPWATLDIPERLRSAGQ